MSRTEQKAQTRRRILNAVGRGFRRSGFGGVGVDGLARQAGVTSGAFYVHFPSKEAAFQEAVVAGIDELRQAIESLRETHDARWIEALVDFYLGDKRTCDLGESCAMQSLVPEVGRADDRVKSAVEPRMRQVAVAIADGLPEGGHEERLDRAWSLLALLTGGVSLARAVHDPEMSERIAAAVREAALEVARPAMRDAGTGKAEAPGRRAGRTPAHKRKKQD